MTINEADFERLSQLLDGELDAVSRQQLEQRIALEPELASTWQELKTINATLRQTYAGATTGIPQRITAMLDSAAGQGRAKDNVAPFFRRQPLWPAALAASVVLALAIALTPDDTGSSSATAGLTLAAALESLPSGSTWTTLEDGGQIQPVLTFPSRDGGWCREYALKQTSRTESRRGVACRKDGQWQTEVVAQAPEQESSDVYRPAGAGDSRAVHHFIRDQAADIPLSGPQESALIDSGWR